MENQNQPVIETEEKSDLFPMLRVCWEIFTHTWKWFLASVIACLALGYLYNQSLPRVYQRQSVMLIEDAEPSGSMSMGGSRRRSSSVNTLMELNGISVGDNLKNEQFILTSQRLMERVVDSLHIDVDYTMRTGLNTTTLYKDSPVDIAFADTLADEDMVTFSLRVAGHGKFEMTDFKRKGKKIEGTVTATAGTEVNTPTGRMTLRTTRTTPKFDSETEVQVTRMSRRMAAARFRSALSASDYDKESSLIVLSCQDNNEQRAEDILLEVFRAYKNDVVENKNRVAQNTANFIDERIALIGAELSDVENSLASFKQQNHIINFQSSAQAFITETSSARAKSIEMETQLEVARYLKSFLHDNGKAKQLIPALDIPGANFSSQIQEYNTMTNERNRLALNSSESASAVVEMDRQLREMRHNIITSVDNYVRTTELQVREARANEMALSGQVSGVPEKEKQALSIERQQTLKAALYTYLLNKREEVTLQLAINEANVRMVEYPMGSHVPVSPRPRIILLISLLLGLCLPAAAIYIRRLFDVTISSRDDIEQLTTIPVVGELPRWKEPGDKALIADCAPTESIVEAFRVLRYGIHFLRRDARVFICTSSTPGQGKSFVSSNLAIAMAMTGKRILLIDADIRRRTLSRAYRATEGLTGYLAEDNDAARSLTPYIIKDAIYPGVDFMPAGVQPPNTAELLMSNRLETLVAEARTQYDQIIFDATPAFSVADAEILARVTDMMLYIVRVGVQEKGFLPDLEKFHKSGRLKNIAIVVNDADLKTKIRYGYGYGYGYSQKKKNIENAINPS